MLIKFSRRHKNSHICETDIYLKAICTTWQSHEWSGGAHVQDEDVKEEHGFWVSLPYERPRNANIPLDFVTTALIWAERLRKISIRIPRSDVQ